MKIKFKIIIVLLNILIISQLNAGVKFKKYFINKTMRIDYFHVGDKTSDEIVFDLVYKQGEWAGNRKSLIDNFNNGKYYHKIYDLELNKLIYSKGFNNYFGEYQATEPASKGT